MINLDVQITKYFITVIDTTQGMDPIESPTPMPHRWLTRLDLWHRNTYYFKLY